MTRPTKVLRAIEWLLAFAWLVVLLISVSIANENSSYDNYREMWLPIVTFLPMISVWFFGLFSCAPDSKDDLDAQRRFALAALLGFSVFLSLGFFPDESFGSPNLLGVFVPIALQGFAIYLWIGWTKPSMTSVPGVQMIQTIARSVSKNAGKTRNRP